MELSTPRCMVSRVKAAAKPSLDDGKTRADVPTRLGVEPRCSTTPPRQSRKRFFEKQLLFTREQVRPARAMWECPKTPENEQ